MILIKCLLVIFLTVSSSLARNVGQCNKIMAPDAPGERAFINITALQETSLLVFHVTDIEKTNIPLYFNDKTKLLNTEDGFYLCTKELFNDGHCTNVGEFVIRYENGGPQEEIINKTLQKGDTISYNVTDTGVYCIYTHEDHGEGVSYKIVQPYGNLSIDAAQEFDVLLFVLLPLDFAILIFWGFRYWKVLKKIPKEDRQIETSLIGLTFGNFLYHDNKRTILNYLNKNDVSNSIEIWSILFRLGGFFGIFTMISIFWFFYLWTQSPQGKSIVKTAGPGTGKFIRFLLTLYAISSGFFSIFPTKDSTPEFLISFIPLFHYGEKFIKFLIWLTLILGLNRTVAKASDHKAKRKFELSRQLTISIPLIMVFTSIFCQFVISFDTFARTLKKSQSNESVIVNALENTVHYGFVFGLVINLGYFILPLIIIGLIYIWKIDLNQERSLPDVGEIELSQFLEDDEDKR